MRVQERLAARLGFEPLRFSNSESDVACAARRAARILRKKLPQLVAKYREAARLEHYDGHALIQARFQYL